MFRWILPGLTLSLISCAAHLTKQEMAGDVSYARVTAKKVFTSEERKKSFSTFSKLFRAGDSFLHVPPVMSGAVVAAANETVNSQSKERMSSPSRAPIKPTVEWGAKEYQILLLNFGKQLVLLDYAEYEVGECIAVFPDYPVDGRGRLDKTSADNCR